MQKADSLETILMLGKTEGKRRMGWQRMRWLDSIANSMGISLSNLQEIVRTGKPGELQFMGSERAGHDLATEQQQPYWSCSDVGEVVSFIMRLG